MAPGILGTLSNYFSKHTRNLHKNDKGVESSVFASEVRHASEAVLGLSRKTFVRTFDMVRKDLASASLTLSGAIAIFMQIISQGLAALATFLVAIAAMAFPIGMRLIIVTLFLFAVVWAFILGRLTAASRVYAIVVLADSVRKSTAPSTAPVPLLCAPPLSTPTPPPLPIPR